MVRTLSFVIIAVTFCGCSGKPASVPTSTGSGAGAARPVAALPFSDAKLGIVGAPSSDATIPADKGSVLKLEGSYRRAPEAKPESIYVQISVRRNGEEVVLNSTAVKPEQDGENEKFTAELKLPSDSDDREYDLEARYGATTLMRKKVVLNRP